jgi:hypothetical protein
VIKGPSTTRARIVVLLRNIPWCHGSDLAAVLYRKGKKMSDTRPTTQESGWESPRVESVDARELLEQLEFVGFTF